MRNGKLATKAGGGGRIAPRPEPSSLEGRLEDIDTLDTRRFELAIKRLADTLTHGTDRSRFLGSGIEFVQSRPYMPGDPVRAIDWRVTARTGKYFIKEFEAPKSVPAWILLDTSASMTLSSVRRSKYALALHLAGGLALACLDRVSPVGVLGTGDREFRVQPSLSRQRVLQWMLKLRTFRYDEGTALAVRLGQLNTSLAHRSLIIVLSDLHEPDALRALKLAGQTHDVVVVQLQDPAELSMQGAGFLRAAEAETGRSFVTVGRRQQVDPQIVQDALRKRGIDHLVLRTDRPFAQEVRRFFEARGLGARTAR